MWHVDLFFIQELEGRSDIDDEEIISACSTSPAVAEPIVPAGNHNEIEELKTTLLENARLKFNQAPLKQIDFQTAKEYQESKPSLKSLKSHLQYVKCGCDEWQREDARVSKEIFHAMWMFSDKSQTLVVERRRHAAADGVRILVPFRAILGLRFNSATDTLAAHVNRPHVQVQHFEKGQTGGSTWRDVEDHLSTGRPVIPLSLQFLPDKVNFSEMKKQFERQPNLSKALNVGIKPDVCYDLNRCNFIEDPQRKMPVVKDPTLVRAGQKAILVLLNEAKKKGNDLRYLVKMYFGLEERFNHLLRSRIQSAKSSSTTSSEES